MNGLFYDVIIVGAGPAGLAAAVAACDGGAKKVLVIERNREVGGLLNQCLHNDFGLHYFKEELTGPEYAGRFAGLLAGKPNAEVLCDTTVLRVTRNRQVFCISPDKGYRVYSAGAVVLCMGCRELTRGAIAIPGDRPSGVITAGTAQRYLNRDGYLPGKRVVILGSGNIGLAMARRLTLECAKVLACVEPSPYANGLTKNIVQCLNEYNIPLYLSHTVTNIVGKTRLEKVVVGKVDGFAPIPGTGFEIECDTLLLSVGLIPENELTRDAGIPIDPRTDGAFVHENTETSAPGIFACGNVAYIHDLVDNITAESLRAGAEAAKFAAGIPAYRREVSIRSGDGVSYTVPQLIRPSNIGNAVEISIRTDKVRGESVIRVMSGDRQISQFGREHMAPGETEIIRIPAVLFENVGDELTVSIEDKQ